MSTIVLHESVNPWKNARLAMYCVCGAAWGWGSGADGRTVARMKRLFWVAHTGEGHGCCDARTAARARAKSERAAARQMEREARGR